MKSQFGEPLRPALASIVFCIEMVARPIAAFDVIFSAIADASH
jgi:hypothetical protein